MLSTTQPAGIASPISPDFWFAPTATPNTSLAHATHQPSQKSPCRRAHVISTSPAWWTHFGRRWWGIYTPFGSLLSGGWVFLPVLRERNGLKHRVASFRWDSGCAKHAMRTTYRLSRRWQGPSMSAPSRFRVTVAANYAFRIWCERGPNAHRRRGSARTTAGPSLLLL